MVRRLGGRRWQQLHRAVYVVAVAALAHFWWLVKIGYTQPLMYTLIIGAPARDAHHDPKTFTDCRIAFTKLVNGSRAPMRVQFAVSPFRTAAAAPLDDPLVRYIAALSFA